MRIELTPELSPEQRGRWDSFLLASQSAHPEQDPRFAEVHRADGLEAIFAMGFEGETLKAVALFALTPHPFLPGRYSDAMAYSGPVCDSRDDLLRFLAALTSSGLFRKTGRVRITPYWLGDKGIDLGLTLGDLGWGTFELEPVRYTGHISLRPSEEQIYEGFSKGARVEFRKAQRQALTCDFVTDPEQSDEILALLNRHRAGRRMGSVARAGFVASFRHVFSDPRLGVLVVLRHEGRIVAGLAAYCSHHSAHPAYYFTDPEALRKLQNLRIAPFIWHRVAVWAKSNGASWLDVEGFKENTGPGDKLYLVHKYKGDLGASQVLRVAGQGKVLSPALHLTGNARELLRNLARRLRAFLKSRRPPVAEAMV